MPNKKTTQSSIDFITITKRYWKDQIIFYILTTISFLGSYFLKKNALDYVFKTIQNIKEKGGKDLKASLGGMNYELKGFSGKVIHNFEKNWWAYFLIMAIITLIYCGVVINHVSFSYYLCDKIIVYIKKRLVKKIPRINCRLSSNEW